MFNKLEFNAQIARKGMLKKDVAKALGIDVSTLYRKMEKDGDFSREEMAILIELLGIEDPKEIFCRRTCVRNKRKRKKGGNVNAEIRICLDSFDKRNTIYMARNGLNNTVLAKRLGVTYPTWMRYKRNPGSIPMGVLRDYVKVLALTPDEISEVVQLWR